MPLKGTVIGLDIGARSAKAVWAEPHGGSARIRGTEEVYLPLDKSDMAAVIRPWLEKNGITGLPCVIGVPGREAMFQPFLIPAEDPRSFEQAASMEVVKYNEMASEDMVYGYAPFAFDPVEKRMLLAMTRPAVLDRVIGAAAELGVEVVDVVPVPAALFNGFETGQADHADPWIYLDVGHSGTDVAVGTGNNMMFARAFGVGGSVFTETFVKEGGFSEAQAENAKIRDGSLSKGGSAEGLRSAADLWISEMQTCVSVCRSQFPRDRTVFKRIVLSGGASALPGFRDYVGAQTGLETVEGSALKDSAAGSVEPKFAVAAGLAVSGLGAGPSPLSLMPRRLKDELTFKRLKPFWVGAGLAAALTLAVSLAGGFRDIRRNKARLKVIDEQLDHRRLLGAQIDAVKAHNEEIHRMALPVKKMIGAAPVVRDLVTLAANSVEDRDWITLICDAEMYYSPRLGSSSEEKTLGLRDLKRRKKRREQTKQSLCPERVIIEGYTRTRDLVTVKALIRKINGADFVDSADLLSDDKVITYEENFAWPRAARRFVIDVRLASQ
ncbi:MAG: pilus assembly protein PilM [Kiritimatiellia bacterium]